MNLRLFFLLMLALSCQGLFAQNDSIPIRADSIRLTDLPPENFEKGFQPPPSLLNYPSTLRPRRLVSLLSLEAAVFAGSIVVLNEAWYANYPRSGFHFFNDGREWLSQDKIGHAVTTSSISSFCYYAFRWAGVKHVPAVFYGAALGMSYMTTIEMLDGYSNGWGFSSADLAANVFGASLFMTQQLLWQSQRIKLKFSYHPTKYAAYRPEVLGSNFLFRILKDYNGQSHWMSFSSGLFLPKRVKFPRWICLSIGYGAEGMLGGFENPKFDENGNPIPSFTRYRKFYLSLDVDFSLIKTRSKFVRLLLLAINAIKVPCPTLEYNTKGQFRFYPLYF